MPRVTRPLLIHCLCALYPAVDDLPGMAETDPGPFVDTFMREAPLLIKLAVWGGIAAFVLTPVITVFRPVPSFLLSSETLDRHADRIASHDVYLLRSPLFMLKVVAALHWAAHDRIRDAWALEPYPADPDDWRTV